MDHEPVEHDGRGDPWVWYSQLTLGIAGAFYGLLALGAFTLPALMLADTKGGQPPPEGLILAFTLFWLGMCGGICALNLLAAWGLGKRAKWAWVITLIFGGIYAPSICFPFGAVLLYGMLNDRTRKAFLG